MIRITVKPCESRVEQSAIAREILFSALRDEFSLPEAEIKKTKDGKPYFDEDGYPEFSISHTDGAVCVAICDGAKSVGVDIEKYSERLCNKNITDRFFVGLTHTENEIKDIEIVTEGDATVEVGSDVLFTLGEAIIKCDGRGFAVAAEAAELAKKMKKSSFDITLLGVKYALSVALKEKEI